MDPILRLWPDARFVIALARARSLPNLTDHPSLLRIVQVTGEVVAQGVQVHVAILVPRRRPHPRLS